MAKKNKNTSSESEVFETENEFEDVTPTEEEGFHQSWREDETSPTDDGKFDNEDVEEEETYEEIEEDVEEEEPVTMTGTVTTRLNIRENDTGSPDTTIVSIVEGGEKITVYPEEGNATFFKVKTKNGVEGYAMRRYIILNAE